MDCTTIPNCTPQAAAATVEAGTSPVHVGTLTGSALYTSVSSALESLCSPVTGTTAQSCVETDQVTIGGIDYARDDELQSDGEFIVKVASSSYNYTSLRDAMINSAATTAQYSAAGNNCYNMTYIVVEKKKRGLEPNFPLVERAVGIKPFPSHMYVCNAGAFAGVQYFNPFWRDQPTPGASDYLNVEFSFQVGPGGQFMCDFIGVLTDALAVVQPEFAVEDVELGEGLQAICQSADAINGLTMRSIGRWQQDILPEDQAANPYRSLVPASSETSLKKHTDSGENVMDTLIKDLYEGAPSSNKVAAGAPAGVFKLDTGTSGVYTTVECYGCTAVVLFSGKTVVIQLFTEAPFASSSSASTWTDKVITPLESTLIANKDDLGENPLIAIFSPWFANPSQPPTPEWSDTPPPQTPGVFKYKTRLIGSNSIMASIKSDFPNLAA